MSKKSKYFEKARANVIIDHPFYAVLVLHLQEKVMDMENKFFQNLILPTVGVDGETMYVNPEFVEKLNDKEKLGLLVHEIMHITLGHVWPWRRQWRDPKRWNRAGDYVINSFLKKEGFTLPEGGLYDSKYEDMSTEEVYELLEEQDEKGEGDGNDELTIQDVFMGVGDSGDGDDEKDGEGGAASGTMSQHAMQELERQWKERIVEAANIAKMRGKLPAGMERLVDGIVKPTIPWQMLLEQYVNEILRDDYNELMYDRRYIQSGIYLPDMYSEGCSVAIAIDTSGSIGPDEMTIFVSETMGILRSRNVKKVRILACDAAVTLNEEYQPWDSLPDNFPGGGGTAFEPVFEAIADTGERPACLLYLTDMYGSFPDTPPNYPVLWVTMTEDYEPPFGTSIIFNPDKSDFRLERA